MAFPKVKISDDSGNTVDITSNALDVNIAGGSALIDIGDVDLFINGGEPVVAGSGIAGPGCLRVNIATNDPQWGTVGTAADVDGTAHGQLRYIGEKADEFVTNTSNTANTVGTIGTSLIDGYGGTRKSIIAGVLRNDTLANFLGIVADGDFTCLQVDAVGALYTTHGITGGADGVKTVSSAGTDVVLGGDVACKKIDIQAQTDNTGLIAVGFTGVDATEATGTGVILYAGDTYSLEVTNLNLIYIDSTVSGEGVRYTYFT